MKAEASTAIFLSTAFQLHSLIPNMIITSSNVEAPSDYTVSAHTHHRSVSWGAIFAGWTAATSLQVLSIMLGAGLGFAIYEPMTDENPVASVGKGAIVVQGISAVFSLWFGGWVAGRLLPA